MKEIKVNKKSVQNLVLAALFLAVGAVLPLLTAQVKEIGDSLLPMHIPVMLCAFVCGWKYGASVGLILPFFRSLVFGMPPIYPNAVWMALELATYGLVIGLMCLSKHKNKPAWIYLSLVTAQISGRIVWGIAKAVLLGTQGKAFTFAMFWVGGFADALPGIILQIVLIPLIIIVLNKVLKREI